MSNEKIMLLFYIIQNPLKDLEVFCYNNKYRKPREVDTMVNDIALLDTKQVAEILGITTRTVYLWRKQGRIPYIQLGKRFVFPLSDLLAFLEMNRVSVKA